jgi:hypothetical protein
MICSGSPRGLRALMDALHRSLRKYLARVPRAPNLAPAPKAKRAPNADGSGADDGRPLIHGARPSASQTLEASIGNQVRTLRKMKNMTVMEVANQSAVQDRERGDVAIARDLAVHRGHPERCS